MSKKIMILVVVIAMMFGHGTTTAMAAEETKSIDYSKSIYLVTVDYLSQGESYIKNGNKVTEYTFKSQTGTAFYTDDNLFITAAHVLETTADKYVTSATISLEYLDDKGSFNIIETQLEVAYIDSNNDIAILYGNEDTAKQCVPLKIAYDINITMYDASFTIYGWAGTNRNFVAAPGKFQYYNAVSSMAADGTCAKIRYDRSIFLAETYGGMSGGPVIDKDNNVIGILSCRGTIDAGICAGAGRSVYLIHDIDQLHKQEAADELVAVAPAA